MNAVTQNTSKSARRRLRKRERALLQAEASLLAAQKSAYPNNIFPQTRGGNGNGTSRSSRRRRNRASRRGNSGNASSANDYLKTLLDPIHVTGVKIPDVNCFPSATFQLQQSGQLWTGTGGDSFFIKCIPDIQSSPIQTGNGTTLGNISNVTTTTWSQQAAISSMFSVVRPVSACLECEFTGPTSSDGGYWDAFLLPAGTSNYTTVTACEQNWPNMVTDSFSRRKVKVLWRPQDNSDYDYFKTTINMDGQYPQVAVIGSGLPSAVNYARYTWTVNFEAIPISDLANIVSPTPSPINTQNFQTALNLIGRAVPVIYSGIMNNLPQISGALGTIGNAYRMLNRTGMPGMGSIFPRIDY